MQHASHTVFAIYDAKSESWSKPIFSRNAATCQRELRDVLMKGGTMYSVHPEDYTLFEIGTWSEDKPQIDFLTAPLSLGLLIQYAPKGQHFGDDLVSAA